MCLTPWLATLLLLAADPSEVRVGAAAVVITPPLGVPMAGYYSERGATAVHDDLSRGRWCWSAGDQGRARGTGPGQHVTALRGSGPPRDRSHDGHTRGACHDQREPYAHGTDPARTSRRDDAQGGQNERALAYMEKLPGLIAQSVRDANARLAPARISAASGRVEGLAFNRRFHMRDGSVGWNPGKLNPQHRPAGRTHRPGIARGVLRRRRGTAAWRRMPTSPSTWTPWVARRSRPTPRARCASCSPRPLIRGW